MGFETLVGKYHTYEVLIVTFATFRIVALFRAALSIRAFYGSFRIRRAQ